MSLTAAEQLEAMINGTYVDETLNDNGDNDEGTDGTPPNDDENSNEEESTEVNTENTEESENEDYEDTDQGSDEEEEEETDQNNDDSSEDTSENSESNQEENSHNNSEESNDESDNTGSEPNYKEFYEQVALAKFTANGKEVEGFKDPADLIRAQQMLHGYSDKMKVFKEYKPFLKALEERKLTTDADKFNLAMSIVDGDPEAIKKVLKEKGIDPLELDLEDIRYTEKNTLPSQAQMLIEDTYEQAENLGVGDKFTKVINKDWDIKSLQELVTNNAVRADLLQHLSDGTYAIVSNQIKKMELLDATGVLNGMTSIDKYRLATERIYKQNQRVPTVQASTKVTVDKIAEAEKTKAEAEFKRLAVEKEARIAEERRKAASVSKKKVVKKPETKPKLEELSGNDFRAEFNKMLMS